MFSGMEETLWDVETVGKERPPHPLRRKGCRPTLSPPLPRRGNRREGPERGWGEATFAPEMKLEGRTTAGLLPGVAGAASGHGPVGVSACDCPQRHNKTGSASAACGRSRETGARDRELGSRGGNIEEK